MVAIIDYTPLWETMRRNNISQYHLLKNGIDNKTLDSLKKNKNITMITLERLCRIVGCSPNEVVEFKETLNKGGISEKSLSNSEKF